MINNKPFVITYYSASDKKTITRNAFMDRKMQILDFQIWQNVDDLFRYRRRWI